jgi:hypothetical protein
MCILLQSIFVPDDFGEPVEVPPLSEVRKEFQERLRTDPDLRERVKGYK